MSPVIPILTRPVAWPDHGTNPRDWPPLHPPLSLDPEGHLQKPGQQGKVHPCHVTRQNWTERLHERHEWSVWLTKLNREVKTRAEIKYGGQQMWITIELMLVKWVIRRKSIRGKRNWSIRICFALDTIKFYSRANACAVKGLSVHISWRYSRFDKTSVYLISNLNKMLYNQNEFL